MYCLYSYDFHGIQTTRDWTHFLKIRFVVAEGGFYSYYDLQCIKLDKECKKKKFYAYKKLLTQFFQNGLNPVLCTIPHLGHSYVFAYAMV